MTGRFVGNRCGGGGEFTDKEDGAVASDAK